MRGSWIMVGVFLLLVVDIGLNHGDRQRLKWARQDKLGGVFTEDAGF